MRRLAIIPARAGSKGLKDKNIALLGGKPLLAWAVDTAIRSGQFYRILLSTDSEQYAEIGRQYGAETWMRDKSLAGDNATSYAVIADVLNNSSETYDEFMLLQPTSPLRTAQHVCEAFERFDAQRNNFDFLVSMKEAEFTKDLVNIIEEDGSLKHFDKDFAHYRRQDYHYYSPNGAIFIGKPDAYLTQGHFFGRRALAYIMSAEDSVDIDHQIDLDLAEIILKRRKHDEKI